MNRVLDGVEVLEPAEAYREAMSLTSSEPVRRFVARRIAEVESP